MNSWELRAINDICHEAQFISNTGGSNANGVVSSVDDEYDVFLRAVDGITKTSTFTIDCLTNVHVTPPKNLS